MLLAIFIFSISTIVRKISPFEVPKVVIYWVLDDCIIYIYIYIWRSESFIAGLNFTPPPGMLLEPQRKALRWREAPEVEA